MPFRCPYCRGDLPPPPWESARCPHCRRTFRLPCGAAGPRREVRERRRALERIARDADRKRRELGAPPGARLGRQPAFLLATLLALTLLGGSLVSLSRKVTRVPPAQRLETARGELAAIAQALALYAAHVGHFPTAREGDLFALVADPGQPGWRGPYLNRLQPDPWGRPYRYADGAAIPTLLSHGPDRALGTADDLQPDPADFDLSPERAAEWIRTAPRNPTVEIATNPAPETP